MDGGRVSVQLQVRTSVNLVRILLYTGGAVPPQWCQLFPRGLVTRSLPALTGTKQVHVTMSGGGAHTPLRVRAFRTCSLRL